MMPVALTIAGSDPSGGAGIQADLKTFHQFGVYGEAVITLITVQNTVGVSRVEFLSAELVAEQICAAAGDIPPQAAKTGALGSREIVEAVARLAADFRFPLVIDPVMLSKHGARLMDAGSRAAMCQRLIPCAALVTPNLAEAGELAGFEVCDARSMRRAAEALVRMGARAALVKGGHLEGPAVDILYDGAEFHEFTSARIQTLHTHGTGCTYSAAITAELARGAGLCEAVSRAKAYITQAIRTAPGLGGGAGPVNHHTPPDGQR